MEEQSKFSLYGTLAIIWSLLCIPFFMGFMVLTDFLESSNLIDFLHDSENFLLFSILLAFITYALFYFELLLLLLKLHKEKSAGRLGWYKNVALVLSVISTIVVFVFILNLVLLYIGVATHGYSI